MFIDIDMYVYVYMYLYFHACLQNFGLSLPSRKC